MSEVKKPGSTAAGQPTGTACGATSDAGFATAPSPGSGAASRKQSRPSSAPSAGAPPERLWACRLLQRLGNGASGSVYLAEMLEDRPWAARGDQVAVKVLHPHLVDMSTGFERFHREGALGLRIQHPALARTLAGDLAMAGGANYHLLIMEYVAGKTLRERMAELGRVPEALLRHLGAQIASGLAAIHAAGAVHRDLKPSNVILTPEHQIRRRMSRGSPPGAISKSYSTPPPEPPPCRTRSIRG